MTEYKECKYCHKCNQWKVVEDFYKDNSNTTGRTSWCKECAKAHQRSKKQDTTKETITYDDMVKGLREKVHACRIEIEALKEEKQIAIEDFGQDGKDYDEWINEQYDEIHRLHQMVHNLQEVYREVR